MANIPLTYKLDWYDPSQPGGVVAVINNNANTATSYATQYSMQDIIDTVAADAGSVEVSGTPVAGFMSQWVTASTIKGGDTASGDEKYGLFGAFAGPQNWTSGSNTSSMLLLGYAVDASALTSTSGDYENNLVMDMMANDTGTDLPVQLLPSQFEANILIGDGGGKLLRNANTYFKENVIIGCGKTVTSQQSSVGANVQSNVIIGANIDFAEDFGDCSSTVIIGNDAFEQGMMGGTGKYGVFIGRRILYAGGSAGMGNIAIGGSNVAGNSLMGQDSVLIGGGTGYYYDTNNATAADGELNVMVGINAGRYYAGGKQNTFIGYGTGPTSYDATNDGDNNTCIGNGAALANGTTSNEIVLGNASVTTLRCNVAVISALSDERDKTDIVDIDKGLDFVNELKPRKFVWAPREVEQRRDVHGEDDVLEEVVTMVKPSTDGMKDVGFIAQELQTVDDDFLRLVSDANPDKLEVAYGKLVPVLVKAIQELSAKVTVLENK